MPRNQKPQSPYTTSRVEKRQHYQAKQIEITNSKGSYKAADILMLVLGTYKRHLPNNITKNIYSITLFLNYIISNSTNKPATDAKLGLQPISFYYNRSRLRSNTLGLPGILRNIKYRYPKSPDAALIYNINSSFNSPPYNRLKRKPTSIFLAKIYTGNSGSSNLQVNP
ncbi:hypothetical protein V2W45_1490916 [Cenococcum geophilum]